MELETQSYRLRRLDAGSDVAPLRRWLADPAFAAALNLSPRDYPVEDVRRYLASFDGTSAIIIGVADPTGAAVAITTFDVNARHRTASWAFVVGEKPHRHEAAVLEISVAAIEWAYAACRLEKISARVAAPRLPLLRILDGLGIPREGHLRSEILSADGQKRHDEVIFGLLKAEWPAVRERANARVAALRGATGGRRV
ncbi:GNAT family N-acetyltransferase [Mangrovicella endophytica]|uniref:GNAT family N-acetyltransferase n=1 Tax=Mangrovicella endophytica TaxID=2066697 RepID=UPI000C9E0B7F|nr:GNAT family protein [Mangrovicella endophytica]